VCGRGRPKMCILVHGRATMAPRASARGPLTAAASASCEAGSLTGALPDDGLPHLAQIARASRARTQITSDIAACTATNVT
jgi:hypothetical protein